MDVGPSLVSELVLVLKMDGPQYILFQHISAYLFHKLGCYRVTKYPSCIPILVYGIVDYFPRLFFLISI